ncbi:MAG: phytanoyl-CoA dioxygenase family protein [Bryobacteraceae bacterium]
MATLSLPETAARFHNDGFAVLENLFTEEEVAPMSDEVDRIVEGRAGYMPDDDVIYEPDSNPPRLRNAFRMHHYSPFFMEGARHPKIVRVMEEILGKPVRLYGSQLFAKPAMVGTAVPAHQDMPYWPFSPYELVTAWIALDDTRIENGCVRFSLGSHKLGILPHAPSGVKGNSLGLREHPEVAALPEHAVEVPRGSCVLHHCLTVHRSEPNTSAKPRRGLIYVYMSAQVRLNEGAKLKGSTDFPVVSEAGV